MRTARLLGRDHTAVGAIEALSEGRVALALTIGGAVKRYPHTDPNEDAAGWALGAAGALLVVADAHGGRCASQVAVTHLLESVAPAWVDGAPGPDRWEETWADALWETHMTVRRETGRADRQGSRTTLALALVRPDPAPLLWASVGDSHVFLAGTDGAEDLAAGGRPCPPRYFLGSESLTREELYQHAARGGLAPAGARAVVLATDGVSESHVGLEDPAAAVAACVTAAARAAPELRALETARSLVERANAAHRENPSGDNVAVAVHWLG